MKKEVIIKATPGQVESLQPLKKLCEEAFEKRRRGMIVMQIDFDTEEITATFCDHRLTMALINAVHEYNRRGGN